MNKKAYTLGQFAGMDKEAFIGRALGGAAKGVIGGARAGASRALAARPSTPALANQGFNLTRSLGNTINTAGTAIGGGLQGARLGAHNGFRNSLIQSQLNSNAGKVYSAGMGSKLGRAQLYNQALRNGNQSGGVIGAKGALNKFNNPGAIKKNILQNHLFGVTGPNSTRRLATGDMFKHLASNSGMARAGRTMRAGVGEMGRDISAMGSGAMGAANRLGGAVSSGAYNLGAGAANRMRADPVLYGAGALGAGGLAYGAM